MKVKDIRALNQPDLKAQLEEAHEELFNLRFRLKTKQLVNHREVVKVRRTIAQIKTIMREKEMELR